MPPASSARRLLLGTGLGLLLAGGFGLLSGVISIEEPSIGFVIPLIGLVLIALAGPTGRGEGPFAEWFPNEDDGAMASRVGEDIIQEKLIHKFILYQHLHQQYQVKYNIHVDL